MKEKRVCFLCRTHAIREVKKGKRILFYCLWCRRTSVRYFEIFGKAKVNKTVMGLMHYSAGALIENNGKFLVSKRTKYPFMYTTVGGHVDRGETMLEALRREIKEETGMGMKDKKLIFRGIIDPDPCTHGVDIHYWNLFLVHTKGTLTINKKESVSLRWLTKRQMARLRFTPPVTYIFKKINFFNS